MHYDYLIIGQGIAGSLLALELLEKGKSILIIDNHHISSSTKVAAGLYNPVVFKRFAKSWMADELIPFAKNRYKTLEEKFKAQFHFDKNMFKVFASEDERKLWEKRRPENRFMAEVLDRVPGLEKIIKAPFGAGKVIDAGNLDTQAFLNTCRDFFRDINVLMEERLDYTGLEITGNAVRWKSITAEKMIFCEGSKAIENPFFNCLPFKLTKGEILTAKIAGYHTPDVVNKGVFVLPVADETCRIGATYEWEDFSEEPTDKGKSELLDKLEKLVSAPYEILGHQAGIRPTISDRRPLIGRHPQHNSLWIFNGMGTKGVLIAPFFAKHFAEYLEGEIEILDKEVDIRRFG